VAFNTLLLVFGIVFGGAILVFAFVAFGASMLFRRNVKTILEASEQAMEAENRRKVLDVVSQLPPGTPAYKCKACGATVDSTAELSADGRVRCNYCNQWTSIYK
jgi:lipopolysaccharide biosynthesis regulator YciM